MTDNGSLFVRNGPPKAMLFGQKPICLEVRAVKIIFFNQNWVNIILFIGYRSRLNTDILFRDKVLVSPRLAHTHTHVPHKRPPTFTPHTKGKTTVPMGACPPSVLLLARAQRAPPLCVCVVWMLALFPVARVCVCFPLNGFAKESTRQCHEG